MHALRLLLPKEAFQPDARKLWWVVMHTGIFAVTLVLLARMESKATSLLLSGIIGHSMACLAFIAHELSYGTILRSRFLTYPLELFLWGINWIPPTLWRRVHNQGHHGHANTAQDPDRQFLPSEKRLSTRVYSALFYPQRAIGLNPLVALHFIPYILRNIVAAVIAPRKPSIVPCAPPYKVGERYAIVCELGFIALLQYGLLEAVGRDLIKYLLAGPVAACFTSAVVMSYVFTNPFLNPITEEMAPIRGSTSIIVNPFFDRLHQNFSYHTEHHLFPGMNSDYYPALSKALTEQFGEIYQRRRFGEAWKQLWKLSGFALDRGEREGFK